MQQRPTPQPVEQVVAIGRRENLAERVLGLELFAGGERGREQMQIVVPEDSDGRGAERLDPTQYVERPRAAIDEIADEPQTIARRIESDAVEQRLEFGGATLDVADGVGGHGERG